jgi:type II secretory pathway component PulF
MTTLLHAHRAVKDAERRSAFYRSWQASLGMGSTHGNALKHIGMKFGQGATERLREYLGDAFEKRSTLTDALKKAPAGLLEPFEIAFLKLGDETGSLDRSLRTLSDWYQGQHKMLVKLWAKSAYPLFLTLFAAVALPLPLVFKGQTPDYFKVAAAGVAAWWFFGGSVVFFPARFAAGRGKWIRARLARALATAMEAGAPIDRALELSVGAAASPELEACVKKIPPSKRRAQPLSATLRGCSGVPNELIGAIQVAESTGNWKDSVGRMAELYEDGF